MMPAFQKRPQFSDPFGREPPPPKPFYHPSRQKNLKKKEKLIALSPDHTTTQRRRPKSPGDELFLKGSNTLATFTPPQRDESDENLYDETWPSSERPSCTSIDESKLCSPSTSGLSGMINTLASLKTTLDKHDSKGGHPVKDISTKMSFKTDNKDSVLQSYIERFRHGAPMSREEREREAGKREFWWLSQNPPTPSDTSTPKDAERTRSRQFDHSRQSSHKDTSSLLLTSHNLKAFHTADDKTRRLQERADRLMEESTSTFHSSEPAVSTDGLGVTSSSGTGGSFDEAPYRPLFARNQGELPYHVGYSGHGNAELGPLTSVGQQPLTSVGQRPLTSVGQRPLNKEEDILYQWRLRRKMEEAQQGQSSGVKANDGYIRKDVDSKLDGFRRRLNDTLTPPADIHSTSTVHFTPAPQRQATKVDADSQTKASLETNKDSSNVTPPQSPRRSRTSGKPDIASPNLPRRYSKHTDPHLHLMCDLLPCPHAEKYSEKFSELYDKSSDLESDDVPERLQYKQFLPAEKPHSERKREKHRKEKHISDFDDSGESSGKDPNVTDSSVSVETDSRETVRTNDKQDSKHKTREKVSQRRRDTPKDKRKQTQEDIDMRESRQHDDQRSNRAQGVHRSTDSEFSDSEPTSDRHILSDSQHSDDKLRDAEERTKLKTTEPGGSNRETSLSNKERKKKEIKFREVPDQDERKMIRETGRTQDSGCSQGESSHTKTGVTGSSQGESSHTKTGVTGSSQGESSHTKTGVLRPVHSSSPSRPPHSVSSAIGQTVTEHLFDGSTSAVISSVDSWASLADRSPATLSTTIPRTEQTQHLGQTEQDEPNRTQHHLGKSPSPQEEPQSDTDDTGGYESDGEFADDHILLMLRQQRAEYEMKLRQIDDLLQQSSFAQR